jgi:hypothetical protein
MIEEYKDLLTEENLNFINNILTGKHWAFGFVSSHPDKPIWNFDKEPAKPIADLLAAKLPDYTLDDYHINGQTIGFPGAIHKDDWRGATHVFVFFSQDWDYMWGGKLHVFINSNESIIITPKKNTGVLFPSNLFHFAEAPTVPVFRTSIGLKLIKRK